MDEQLREMIRKDYEEWKQTHASQTPREVFEEMHKVSLSLAYDLIDKLRWFEQDTAKQPDEEIEKRVQHMALFLENFRKSYLAFAEIDF
jgi:hypothetical protein